jgi:hypothetical protein
VGNFTGGFLEEETFLGSGEEDPAAPGVVDDLVKILPGVVAENGELEVVLPLRLGMAAA